MNLVKEINCSEDDSVESGQSQTPRSASHHGVKLQDMHHTAESRDQHFSKNSHTAESSFML